MTGVDGDLDHILGRGVQARPKLAWQVPDLIFLTITVAMGEILEPGRRLWIRSAAHHEAKKPPF